MSQLGEVRELYNRLDLTVVGIGAWGPVAYSVLSEVRALAVRSRLEDAGPVAEMLGHWFTADGGVVAQDITRMSIAAEILQLGAAP